MPKTHSVYICQQCGYVSPQLLGKCPECGSWGSLVEQIQTQGISSKRQVISQKAEVINLADIEKVKYERLSTLLEEFDRVLGGGIVQGSLVLVSGDPGIGKSTLLSQLAINVNSSRLDVRNEKLDKEVRNSKLESQTSNIQHHNLDSNLQHPNSKVLYVAGEESAQQIKLRIDRIKKNANLAVLNEVDVDVIIGAVENIKPSLVIIDSIQTLQTSDLESIPGSISQVRESTHRLQMIAKALHIPIFIVGHVTKEGTVAGPKTLEHVVDVVLSLEGDQTNQFRILRATKNRFGPTDEVGIFDMNETGMIEVKNPSKLFLEQKVNAPGSVVIVVLTGLRPILLEIQALVTKTNLPIPRRVGTGIDNNRLQLLVAVLSKRLNLPLYDQDVFINVTGGIKVFEPAADLGICMAIISSLKDKAIDEGTAFIGEVGLLGELRTVRNLAKRETEAKKLGFKNVITPENAKSLIELVRKLFK